ncbi:MAG: GNAT family N-acetyltransferase [archaeon]
MVNIKIRCAEEKDLPAIFRIEKRSYPPELQAPHHILANRMEIFGIRVAELNRDLVGFYTCVPVLLDWSKEQNVIDEIQKNRHPHYCRWFEQYRTSQEFNTLYVTSTAVTTKYQGRGIGKALVQHSLELARENTLAYRASVLRVKGFGKQHAAGMSIDEYIRSVQMGRISSPILELYLSSGFTLGRPLPEYESDRASNNYGIFSFKKVFW